MIILSFKPWLEAPWSAENSTTNDKTRDIDESIPIETTSVCTSVQKGGLPHPEGVFKTKIYRIWLVQISMGPVSVKRLRANVFILKIVESGAGERFFIAGRWQHNTIYYFIYVRLMRPETQ